MGKPRDIVFIKHHPQSAEPYSLALYERETLEYKPYLRVPEMTEGEARAVLWPELGKGKEYGLDVAARCERVKHVLTACGAWPESILVLCKLAIEAKENK